MKIIYFKTLRPGKSFPSKYSKNAPPAVDKCEKESLFLLLLIAARVSPPPRIEISDLSKVFFEITLAIDFVPFEKFSFSKYPAGPFHKTVLDCSIFFLILFIVLDPISKIISLSSILFKSLFYPSPSKLVPTIQSSGIIISQLFSLASL